MDYNEKRLKLIQRSASQIQLGAGKGMQRVVLKQHDFDWLINRVVDLETKNAALENCLETSERMRQNQDHSINALRYSVTKVGKSS